MRKILMVSAAAIIAVTAGARAGTYIPVPMVPGAVSEIAFSINNHNVVAGSYRDAANVEHGFFGPLDGSNWTTFDFPGEGTTGTEPRYINDHGAITGIALNPNFRVGEEFYRSPKGKFKIFSLNGQPLDGIAQGMNATGASAGDYIDADSKVVGYIGQKGKYAEDFKLHLKGNKNFWQVSPRGIDDLEQNVVGLFVDQNGFQHGFWQNHVNGSPYLANQIDYPGAQATALEDDNGGIFTGQRTDSSGNIHAFVIVFNKGVVDLDPQNGSTSQQAWGANRHGMVALSTNIGQSYIYCPKKDPDKCPSGASMNTLDRPSVTMSLARVTQRTRY
jgi:hypothetical protein